MSAPRPDAGVPRALDLAALLEVLPHRPPALLLERAPWVERDRAVGVTRPLGLEAGFVPRPADGTVAEPLVLEAVAQTVAVAIAAGDDAPRLGALAAIPSFRFDGRARAGERLTIEIEIERRKGRLVTARGDVFAGARRIGAGRITVATAL